MKNKHSFDMANWPSELPPLDEYVAGVRERAAGESTVFICDETLNAHAGPFATWIGDVKACAPGETWPERNGRPMVGVCQFNLTQCPAVPKCLEGIALLAVFFERMSDDDYVVLPGDDGWTSEAMVIRTYARLDDLAPYPDQPDLPNPYTPCAARPELLVEYQPDYPEIQKTSDRLGLPQPWMNLVTKALEDAESSDGENKFGTKVGGWPAPIQGGHDRPLAFQVGSEDEADMCWMDSGCVFVWKDGAKWDMDIEFY